MGTGKRSITLEGDAEYSEFASNLRGYTFEAELDLDSDYEREDYAITAGNYFTGIKENTLSITGPRILRAKRIAPIGESGSR